MSTTAPHDLLLPSPAPVAEGVHFAVSSAAVTRAWLPPALLAGYALLFGWRALGRGLLAFDDHPGQLYRLAHAVSLGPAPWRMNPGWWAGYAELQYYPPGFSWLGAGIYHAALGSASLGAVYQILLWLAYLLPGAATYLLLRRTLASAWLALPGAFVALTLSAATRSGVEEGMRWGLVAARVGWGLLPLLALSLHAWATGGSRLPLATAVVLGAIILIHPAHAPAAVVLIALAAAAQVGWRRERLGQATLVVGLGFGLSAVWLLPLLAHLSMALPLAWDDAPLPALALRVLSRPLLLVLVLGHAAAWCALGRGPCPAAPGRWLLGLAPVMTVLIVLDAAVARPLGLAWLPADRLMDSLVLGVIFGASLGLALLGRRLPRFGEPGSALASLALAAVLAWGPSEPTLSLWPAPGDWPTYREVVRGVRLDALWQALKAVPPGRVLFVRSSVPLDYRPEWWRAHTHLTALTPLEAGREILNGTFTHPSPVAGLLYAGTAGSRPVTLLVERRDGITLFGRPLEALTSEEFNRLADRLAVSAVIALDLDQGRIGFLVDNPRFGPGSQIGPFKLFRSADPHPLPVAVGDQRWRFQLAPGPGGWIGVPVAYSPLWRVSADGARLPTRRDALGLLEIEAPAGPISVELTHRPGFVEWTGVGLSVASGLGLVALRRRRAHLS